MAAEGVIMAQINRIAAAAVRSARIRRDNSEWEDFAQIARLAAWNALASGSPGTYAHILARNAVVGELRSRTAWWEHEAFRGREDAAPDLGCSAETPDQWLIAKQRLAAFERRRPGLALLLADARGHGSRRNLAAVSKCLGVSESRVHQIAATF